MAMPDLTELSFIRTFIDKSRLDRYICLISSAKRRSRLARHLAVMRDLNWDLCHKIPSDRQTLEQVLGTMRHLGAPCNCRLISESKELDGKEMPLAEALAAFFGLGIGTILISIPDRLAYCEGEGENARYLCIRQKAHL